ncbi:unnamed protein product, partial [Didymodactylos carnosus]
SKIDEAIDSQPYVSGTIELPTDTSDDLLTELKSQMKDKENIVSEIEQSVILLFGESDIIRKLRNKLELVISKSNRPAIVTSYPVVVHPPQPCETSTFVITNMFSATICDQYHRLKKIIDQHGCIYESTVESKNIFIQILKATSQDTTPPSAHTVNESDSLLQSPDVSLCATVSFGRYIDVRVGDLATQKVNFVVVCSTSGILRDSILKQAGSVVKEDYDKASKTNYDSLIELNPGNLNCEKLLFLPWNKPVHSSKLAESLRTFVSVIIQYIAFQANTRSIESVAFPAIGCGKFGCPVDIVAKEMIFEAKKQLEKTKLNLRISFVMLKEQQNVFREFSNAISIIQRKEDAFAQISHKLSSISITLKSYSKGNIIKCQQAIELFFNNFKMVSDINIENSLKILDQSTINAFYKYCMDNCIIPTVDNNNLKLCGEKMNIVQAENELLKYRCQLQHQIILHSIACDVAWAYRTEDGWVKYSYRCNLEIENAYITLQKHSFTEIINEQSEICRIDFDTNIEVFDKRQRTVSRLKLDPQLPLHWEPQEENCWRFTLGVNSDEYKIVKAKFDETMINHYTEIVRTERIQNQRWFRPHKEEFKAKLKKDTEMLLFHGCSEGVANKIVHECFNRTFAGAHGVAYGKGAYFATCALYSHGFAPTNGQLERSMFL